MELIESRVYTREQVADILQVSIASVDRYIKENRAARRQPGRRTNHPNHRQRPCSLCRKLQAVTGGHRNERA